MATLAERVATLEQQLKDVNEDISEMYFILNGPPRAESLRGRVHKLESTDAAVKLLEEVARSRSHRAWTVREKVYAAVITTVIAVSPWVQPFIHR